MSKNVYNNCTFYEAPCKEFESESEPIPVSQAEIESIYLKVAEITGFNIEMVDRVINEYAKQMIQKMDEQ